MSKLKPVVLCILDGWGERDDPTDNAIAQARTPHWDTLKNENPFGTLSASQGDVGLPPGQMGNSEVGHMNIGAGRVVVQDLPRIDAAIADGSLATNAALLKFVRTLKQQGGTCHLMGLLSDGGVHAQLTHLAALANTVASHGVQVYVHAFTDGRDVAPKSALSYLEAFAAQSTAPIVTIGGRYYGMDRDKRWERIAKAYAAIVQGQGATATDARAAVDIAYADDITDEFIVPTVLQGYTGMKSGDGILMGNFRADRARQLLTALLDPNFAEFNRSAALSLTPLGMVEYSEALNQRMPAIFPSTDLRESLPEVVANAGLKQLRIAETEKYAHVTFFFSGGREEPFAGEDRILVPSPKVATYDLKPEMSAYEVTDKLVTAIESGTYDFIVVNYANTDMVGHSGNLAAAIGAVEAVDACLGRLAHAVRRAGGALVITADHGNAECMHDVQGGQPHTAHTLNLVPLVIMRAGIEGRRTLPQGVLADIAPTVLPLLGLAQPSAMTGRNLLDDRFHASVA